MKLRIAYLVFAIGVAGLAIGLPFSFDNSLFTDSMLGYYIASKVVFFLTLIAAVTYSLVSKAPTGSSSWLTGIAFAFQLVPLGLRYLLLTGYGAAGTWCIVIMVLCVLAFVGLALGLSWQDGKMVKNDDDSAGKTNAVEPEKVSLKEDEKK